MKRNRKTYVRGHFKKKSNTKTKSIYVRGHFRK